MRILIAHKVWYVKGGVERYVINLDRLLTEKGHQVIPFTCAHPSNEHTGFESFYPPYRDLSRVRMDADAMRAAGNIIYSREARKAVARLLDAEPPDLVHCRNIYHHLSPSILYEFKKRGLPVVMTVADYKLICPAYRLFHDGRTCTECRGGHYGRAIRNRCVKGSRAASLLSAVEARVHDLAGAYVRNLDKILAPSRFSRDMLADFGIPEEKLGVLRHFIDPVEWGPGERMDAPGDRPYVAVVGRLSDEKGVDVAIAAIGRAEGLDLVVVGEGPEEARLREMAEREAPGRVTFLGHQGGEDLKKVVRGSLCVVVPSICYEAFGFSILESFALGRPVIASRIGGIPELVKDWETGLTFEPGDAADLAEKLSLIADRPEVADEMGANARRLVETDFAPEEHYEALMRVYRSVIGA